MGDEKKPGSPRRRAPEAGDDGADRARRTQGRGGKRLAIVAGVVILIVVAGGLYLHFRGGPEPSGEGAPVSAPAPAVSEPAPSTALEPALPAEPEPAPPAEPKPAPAPEPAALAAPPPAQPGPAAAGEPRSLPAGGGAPPMPRRPDDQRSRPTGQTKQTDWCEIAVPKTVKAGETVEIRVTVRGLNRKVYLCCDLKDANNEMMKWGGPERPLEEGQQTVYRLPVRDKPGLKAVYAYLMAFADKEKKQELGNASTPHVEVLGASKLPEITYNKSWIYVDASNRGKQLVSGDAWEVPVEYYLDPSEHLGTTTLSIWGTGPWIDSPDGKYAKKRGHIGHPGLSKRVNLTKPGKGRHVFTFTVPPRLEMVKKNNRVLFVVRFRDAGGKDWPWHVRAGNSFIRKRGFFEIETAVPGHLFTYEEPVRVAIRLKNVETAGEKKILSYKVHDTTGALVKEGRKEFTVEKEGQEVAIDLDIRKRGVFLIELEVPGWEKRHTTFARIPDLRKITGGAPTRFGMTTHWDAPREEVWAVSQRLGLTTCRRFTRWYRLQPGPDVYKLDSLEEELDTAKKYGVKVWACIVAPPAHAFAGRVTGTSYSAFACKWDVWREFVRTVTTRLKGKLYGWEWLNEINPGGADVPAETYVKMCRIGTETAKAIDPNIITILAGGLYPRGYRVQMLSAGVGEYIDALPVHYQNGDGVLEARQDLDAAGCTNVAVWEDESARGLNAWGVPPLEELANTAQSDWLLMQWTDELAAGCEKIIYFGGKGSAAGSHGYLLDDLSPRPSAATLAVFTSKMFRARPLGVFLLGRGGLFHLFERDGKSLLVASTYEKGGEKVVLNAGTERLLVTDYQGNESEVSAPGGEAELALAPVRYFIEGGDLDVLKAYVVPEVRIARVGAGTSANVARARRITPRVSMLTGREGKLAVRIRNLYGRRLAGNMRVSLPAGWPSREPLSFSLPEDADDTFEVSLTVPEDIEAADYEVKMAFRFDWKKLPPIDKPVVLSVISPDMLGSLMPNGDFETPDETGKGPAGWKVNGKTKMWASSVGADGGLGDGLGKRVLKFENCEGWEHCGRTIPLRGGQTYLYTAWVRNEDMGCGSNMTQRLADGREIRLYDNQVFTCGKNNPYWQVFTCRKEMPAGTESVSFTPVVRGPGWAMYDNIRVTIFEGTDYAAEAHRTKARPRIDGRLDDWVKKCPVPLIGKNQLTVKDKAYSWTPEELSAVGYLMWDDSNLYVAFKVRDDVHHATGSGRGTGEGFIEGDSLIFGIDPTGRGRGAGDKAFAYYLSSSLPGGGSGKLTLFRPGDKSGGRPAGHLFKDSSIYDMAIASGKGVCIYELRIPFSELGLGVMPEGSGIGTKIRLSVQLNDNDGGGRVAQMNWGGGLSPRWLPKEFGVVTLVE